MINSLRSRRLSNLSVLVTLVAAGLCSPFVACDDAEPGGAEAGAAGSGGGGGAASGGGGGAANGGGTGVGGAAPVPGPGEACDDQPKATLTFSPSHVFVAPGESRQVVLTIQPDMCQRRSVALSLDGTAATLGNVGGALPFVASGSTAAATVDLTHVTVPIEVKGGTAGSSKLKASLSIEGEAFTAEVPITVAAPTLPACSGKASGKASGKVVPGGKLGGSADVAHAELGLQANADKPAQATKGGVTYATSVLWPVSAFDATVGCSSDIVPQGHKALGPAITFGPEATAFPREVPMAIPINLAAMPPKARLKHLRVAYSGPAFKQPRVIPVADQRVEQVEGGGFVLRFLAPRLGTYQAVVAADAGEKPFKRKLTHRAMIGVSMGGGGTALLGMRHHDLFDVLAPLGGPVDWTYMLDHIERNHVAGFLPNDGSNAPAQLAPMPAARWPYEHPSTFNAWWYEYPKDGNGGSFARSDYSQIFRDLALQFGNPSGENKFPGGEHLPPGVDPSDKAQTGGHDGDECLVWVDPYDGPNRSKQEKLDKSCPFDRCKHTQTLTKFYDREFNPKGTWPVITVCDGSPQKPELSPYANTWSDKANDRPLEVALAVDFNGNGKRDQNEPVIRQGHEPFGDVGSDGLASADEPGYQPGVNEDPAGDDYDPQYNPTGTERDGRYQQGEPFDDFGLDGVANTKDSPYDVGEGDGQFTVAKGLANFWQQDARSIVRQWVTPPGGAVDDDALRRVDLWVDGGLRDLFNFAVAAQHLTGAYAARGRSVGYYTDLRKMPGQELSQKYFSPQTTDWNDTPSAVLYRYGAIDPTPQELSDGTGQHVGRADELTGRLQSALYYIGSHWPDAPRSQVFKSADDPVAGATACEVNGTCTFEFTDSRGRKGPVTINFPPGYSHKQQQNVRYPVIYMLHGYGQTPEDLGAAIVFLSNWMNSGLDSYATRLPRAILVYVDGRCREDAAGKAECLRGSFYADSPREHGGKLESFFMDLTKEIDGKFRTMPASEVEWVD